MKFFTGLTVSVVLFCIGLVAYRALMPRVGGVQFAQLPPQTQKQRRVEAQQLVQKVEAIAREARQSATDGAKTDGAKSGRPKPFTIEASEEQLNTLLQDRLRTEKFPISDLSVGLTEGVITLQGNAAYGGTEWPATISGALKARDGALQYNIESLSVTGLPAPANLREKAQKAIEARLQQAFAGQKGARLDAVEIKPGKLILRGQTGR